MTGTAEALVISFRAWRRTDVPRLGGKAIGLVVLRDGGCAVPDAFCVTTEAFRAHLDRAGVVGDDKEMLAAGDAQRTARCASIRRRIVDTPLEGRLAGEIEAALAALPAGPFAVRSSGTREDLAAAAFAGLHDTRLGVPDLAGCLEAIRECWSSFFSDRAVTYAVRRGISPSDEAMALLAGQGGIASAESGYDLWKLAAWARQRPAVDARLRSAGRFADARAELATTPEGRTFLDRWDAVLGEHGHHARGEIELLNPRWSEQPDYVLTLLRGYLDSVDELDPIAQRDALGRRAGELAGSCRRRLRNPVKRRIFNVLLQRTRAGAAVRENLKNEIMRLMAVLRSILLTLGAKLRARGAVEAPDDVFFLDRAELAPVVRDDADLRAVVRARRAEHARDEAIVPPAVVVGRYDGSEVAPETPAPSDSILRGIAASPGRATGPARVILRADDGEQIRAGEILVAPFTDPGWTPYFVPAAGIVLDRGGLLSHGSIVAREYGVPSVVNVGRATTTIRTGQMLAVDGDRGEVRLL
jgi:phosphohistidine swiveling domain-containing protein